jgi:hypothetical protein
VRRAALGVRVHGIGHDPRRPPKKGLCMCVSESLTADGPVEGVPRLGGSEQRRRMAERKGRRARVVAMREAVGQLVLARPQLVELSPEQEREAADSNKRTCRSP